MRLKFATASALVIGLAILAISAQPVDAAPGYSYSVVGNPADVVTPTSGLLVLQGGGTDVTRTSSAWEPAPAAAISS